MGQNISCRGKKRHRAKSSRDQNRRKVNMSRTQVYISDDTWLEAIKFLTCPQWSQKVLLNRQTSEIVERNISRLPKFVLDDASMYYMADEMKKSIKWKYAVFAVNTIQKHKSKQWFKDRGFTFAAPADVTAENVLIGAEKWTRDYMTNLNFCICAIMLEEIPRLKIQKNFSATSPILYRAQFNPVSNQYSWAYLAQFLEFVYHPMSYIKVSEQ
ncbi:hypothetical protein Ddc_24911 [Ditylenchus destructor]|nr:hypothetical protein Ddc_24911 [Ditylenchus destructor]